MGKFSLVFVFLLRMGGEVELSHHQVGDIAHQFYLSEFISQEEESQLIKTIESVPRPKWTHLSARSLQSWGGQPGGRNGKDGVMLEEPLPEWLSKWCHRLQETLHLDQQPFFPKPPNHILINKYLPGQGILAHEDGPLYEPFVAMINLAGGLEFDIYKRSGQALDKIHTLWMEPRSLWIMTDQVYQNYLHGVADRTDDTLQEGDLWPINFSQCSAQTQEDLIQQRGQPIPRPLRYSLTFRIVLRSRKMPKGLLAGIMGNKG